MVESLTRTGGEPVYRRGTCSRLPSRRISSPRSTQAWPSAPVDVRASVYQISIPAAPVRTRESTGRARATLSATTGVSAFDPPQAKIATSARCQAPPRVKYDPPDQDATAPAGLRRASVASSMAAAMSVVSGVPSAVTASTSRISGDRRRKRSQPIRQAKPASPPHTAVTASPRTGSSSFKASSAPATAPKKEAAHARNGVSSHPKMRKRRRTQRIA